MTRPGPIRRALFAAATIIVLASVAIGATVSVKVSIQHPESHSEDRGHGGNVVIWLRPLDGTVPPPPAPRRYEMTQRNKEFHPHVLAVPAGANVVFPNLDPWFHNVFSLYKGERFDLGLYEAGSSRTVRFEKPGVSFVFCNIHPEMSAYVLALETPYFAVSDSKGEVRIPGVPAGRYRMEVWYERAEPQRLAALAREISVSDSDTALAAIAVPESEKFIPAHTDKHGKPYTADKIPY